jgi:hypothetical protein
VYLHEGHFGHYRIYCFVDLLSLSSRTWILEVRWLTRPERRRRSSLIHSILDLAFANVIIILPSSYRLKHSNGYFYP